jgi:signal transduction histidine kinase
MRHAPTTRSAVAVAAALVASFPSLATAQDAGAGDRFLPHGYCFLWNKPLLWTHVASDVAIGLSYVVIAGTLVHFIRAARRDLPFSYVFLAFGLFIIACGGTHFMEVLTFWVPAYELSGAVKVVTAGASLSTAVILPYTVPRVHLTIREAKLARERERAAARAGALEESNAALERQARELEAEREQAVRLAAQLREANAELARLNASLEDALERARTAQASAEEARHLADSARITAEEANAAKADFLAVMSHELRTPLQAVIGYAELLDMGISGSVTPGQREQLDRIRGSARHLVSLIDQILVFARLEAGAERMQLETSDPVAVALDTAAMLRPLAEARGLAFDLALPAHGTVVMHTDVRAVRQALVNLVANAIKYTPSGRVALALRHEPGTLAGDEDDVAVFEVRDTGVGIAAEHRARIFEPFWQVAPALTRDGGGTGLGLAVVREIARALGGEVSLESEPGVGSTFTLRLPLRARVSEGAA